MKPPTARTRRTKRELVRDGSVAAVLASLGVLLILVSLGRLP